MSAKVIEKGFAAVGFNQEGHPIKQDVLIVRAEVPGPHGDWCYVVKESKFCWVKGLKSGFLIYEYPLEGSRDSWQAQIEVYLSKGQPNENDPCTKVIPGVTMALATPKLFLVSE